MIIAALIGTINVTGSETGVFLSIEQALMPQTVNNYKKRTTMFALYNMAGTFAMAAGILLSGLPSILQQQYEISQVDSIKPLFLLYSIFGIALIGIYFFLSKKIELSSVDLAKPLSQCLMDQLPKIQDVVEIIRAVESMSGFLPYTSEKPT